jgi:hypothetical protein
MFMIHELPAAEGLAAHFRGFMSAYAWGSDSVLTPGTGTFILGIIPAQASWVKRVMNLSDQCVNSFSVL